jgi:hypothetical protein
MTYIGLYHCENDFNEEIENIIEDVLLHYNAEQMSSMTNNGIVTVIASSSYENFTFYFTPYTHENINYIRVDMENN